MTLGPLMIDMAATSLTDEERRRLSHPLVGGLILFSRNYENPAQLTALCAEVHALRSPRLLIAIDHEGGRVQRCRAGFTRLPAMRRLGEVWDKDSAHAEGMAQAIGFILAAELRACGVDMSFTPVLDLDWGRSAVIGDRSFHADPRAVVCLAAALIKGLRAAGMAACGKHFPGHGWVEADSHVAIPVDERSLADLQPDMTPFRQLGLDAIMPAHVIYPECDALSAGFSRYWIQYLRNEIGFDGLIFSDDLSMQGASVAGGIVERANAAYRAGCNMLLVCNAPDAAGELLVGWEADIIRSSQGRIERLLPTALALSWDDLRKNPTYQNALRDAATLLSH